MTSSKLNVSHAKLLVTSRTICQPADKESK